VVITDPKEVTDPMSDVVAALARQVQEVRHRLQKLSTEAPLSEETGLIPNDDGLRDLCLKELHE
jgi:hypothetical protein